MYCIKSRFFVTDLVTLYYRKLKYLYNMYNLLEVVFKSWKMNSIKSIFGLLTLRFAYFFIDVTLSCSFCPYNYYNSWLQWMSLK